MGTPNAVMLVTREMEAACFAEADIDRIAAVTRLRRATRDEMTEETQLEDMTGADITLTGWGTLAISDAMLDAAPGLKLMCHSAGSIKHLVSDEFVERGVRVCSARYALATGVAEFAFGLMLTSMKGTFQYHAATLTGEWDRERHFGKVCEPHNATVGIVGASCVGRKMIDWCKLLDLKALLLYDPYVSAEKAAATGVEKAELDDLMRRSDVVSLHTPNTDECHHLINAERLAMMRDDAIFINTARGGCVDEPALIAELEKGRLFACIDVTDPEPPEADNPLYALPNCVLTPHVAGSIKQNRQRQGHLVTEQVEAFVRGEDPFEEIDLGLLERFA
ncbi:MAG: hydroxyacid dehydrogenase [bacterium]|nr:hydroxyacid dehydrogenase [bacterium]